MKKCVNLRQKTVDLRQKTVIDVTTAEKIGYIRDMDIDFDSGVIKSVTIPRGRFFGLFGERKNITVPWDNVTAIGSEFVLVKISEHEF